MGLQEFPVFLDRSVFTDWHQLDGPKKDLSEVADRLIRRRHWHGHAWPHSALPRKKLEEWKSRCTILNLFRCFVRSVILCYWCHACFLRHLDIYERRFTRPPGLKF